MSSTIHLKGVRSPSDGQLLRAEPELTPSTRKKISMLPGLKRQQLLEQQISSTDLLGQRNNQAETVVQSSDQVAKPSQAASDTQRSGKPTNLNRYTISGRTAAPATTVFPSQANDVSEMSERASPVVNHRRKPSYVVNVTDFDVHRGEPAVTRPPVVSGDLLSRLEGLRQYKEWSARIHDNAHQQPNAASKPVSPCLPAVTDGGHAIERREERTGVRACSARIEHDLPLRHDSELLERNIDAPTPFSSPQVTPVPSTIAHKQRQHQPSVSLPDFDLSAASSQDPAAHIQPTNHSKVMIVSSESPSLQLAPRSRSASRTRPDFQVSRRANSKPRSHPPISFPKDFYERFPHVEENSTPTREPKSQGNTRPSPGVSPKTIPINLQENPVVPDEIEPLATPHDKRDRPTFYTTIHYFTDCPHASPPANRPLDPNAQPRPDPDFHSDQGNIIRSIIPGACFNCDVAHRRYQEDDIINTNSAWMAQLTDELARALDEFELDETDDEDAGCLHDRFSARLLTSSTFAEDKFDLDIETAGARELPPVSDDVEVTNALRSGKLRTVEQKSYLERVTQEIRDLEARIDCLRDAQDEQIKKVWSGFTPRWGPATLGVQRGRQMVNTSRATSADDSQMQSRQHSSTATEDADEIQTVTVGTANTPSVGGGSSSNGTSRDRSGSSRSRSGARTPTTSSSVSARDTPGSRTPGEGKMRVGWIREEKN